MMHRGFHDLVRPQDCGDPGAFAIDRTPRVLERSGSLGPRIPRSSARSGGRRRRCETAEGARRMKGISKIVRADWTLVDVALKRTTEDCIDISIHYSPLAEQAGAEPYTVATGDNEEDGGGNVKMFRSEAQALRAANKLASEFGGWEEAW